MILNKIKFLLITIFIFSNIQSAILALELLPKKKPVLSKQDIEIKKTKNLLIPKKKPISTDLYTDETEKLKNIAVSNDQEIKKIMGQQFSG